jgi:hypothetical protein
MTLLASVLAAILTMLQSSFVLAPTLYLNADDPRDKNNQAPFHEEQMGLAGQSGHCPHG